MFHLTTRRIGLRKFRSDDLGRFAEINSNHKVMEFFPKPLTQLETQSLIDRINVHLETHGFGLWAAEHLASGVLMGFVGIQNIPYETEFTPAVEIGWRLSPQFWGLGLATEAANACVAFGFEKVRLNEIVSFTAIANRRSYRVMERIGMKRAGEFDHPKLTENHPLQRHVLYRIGRLEYEHSTAKKTDSE